MTYDEFRKQRGMVDRSNDEKGIQDKKETVKEPAKPPVKPTSDAKQPTGTPSAP